MRSLGLGWDNRGVACFVEMDWIRYSPSLPDVHSERVYHVLSDLFSRCIDQIEKAATYCQYLTTDFEGRQLLHVSLMFFVRLIQQSIGPVVSMDLFLTSLVISDRFLEASDVIDTLGVFCDMKQGWESLPFPMLDTNGYVRVVDTSQGRCMVTHKCVQTTKFFYAWQHRDYIKCAVYVSRLLGSVCVLAAVFQGAGIFGVVGTQEIAKTFFSLDKPLVLICSDAVLFLVRIAESSRYLYRKYSMTNQDLMGPLDRVQTQNFSDQKRLWEMSKHKGWVQLGFRVACLSLAVFSLCYPMQSVGGVCVLGVTASFAYVQSKVRKEYKALKEEIRATRTRQFIE